VDVVQGHARIVNPWTVAITLPDGKVQQLTTRSIVIAAGARPVVPDLPGLADSRYVTSDTLWETFSQLDELPKRLIVLGGGPIGCELAQSFARLGSQVTQVEASAGVLSREDADVSALIAASLQADGVRLLTGHHAVRCERHGDEKVLVVRAQEATGNVGAQTQSPSEISIPYDQLLVAVGRTARLEDYGLEELSIPTGKTVQTNEYLQTIYPNIYAAGDVAGPFQFTHTAAHQAWYAAVNALFGDYWRFAADYSVIPSATFTDPEVARVGLNESEARAKGMGFEVTRFALHELDRAVADSETHGFIKVLTVPGKDTILGATVVGHHAADVLAEYVLAMKQGLGLNTILGTIHTYPTMSEASKYAAGAWKRAHQPDRLLHWVRRFHAWRRGHTPPQ
jgi:pyruvate/2-oxoglutarate dehydrogenase complex dihydrolipoamide dehydrogenase (E3) component